MATSRLARLFGRKEEDEPVYYEETGADYAAAGPEPAPAVAPPGAGAPPER